MCGVMGKTARRVRSWLSFFLVLSIVSIDAFVVLDAGLIRVPLAHAATGNFSVFRESGGGDVVTSSGFAVTWDTSVTESANIPLAVNDTDINLTEGGKYLVLYNVWTEEGAAGGTNRRSVASYLTLNDVVQPYGWGAGFIRDTENDLTAYNSGAAILEASAGDDLQVVVARDDTNTTAGTAIRPSTNGVSVLKLDDSLDYLRVQRTVNVSDISGNTAFTPLQWDASDEVDTSRFAFTPTSANVTLIGGSEQFYLVTANVRLDTTAGGGTRQNYEMRLTLDGTEIPGTRSNAYLRGTDGTWEGTLQYVGLIKKTSASNQTLNLEVRRESQAGATTAIVGGRTALSMVALPSSADVISLSTASDEALTSSRAPLAWTDQLATPASNFSHATSSNSSRITIDEAGNYLFFASTYTSRTSGTGRDVPRLEWQLDGVTVLPYGGHGSYNRGDQGTQDAYTSGASSGVILDSLTAGQYVELLQSDETTGTPVADFIAGRSALQAVEITSLAAVTDVSVSVIGSGQATTSPSQTNTWFGQTFAISERTAGRNVTAITMSEAGSVGADVGLTNVRLYYELDTTAPYTCDGVTFSGSESQYGATSTFSGVDGSITFTDNVSITPTQALCVFVVVDVTAATRDVDTIQFQITNPTVDVVVTGGGSIGPGLTIGTLATVVEDAEITQGNYHWRNDDGSEVSATSATGGVENTPGLSFSTSTSQRVRIGVYTNGTGIESNNYRLEYAQKATTCEAATGWSDVGISGGAWDMFDSLNLAEGGNTTNISVASGGVSDDADVFVSPNGGVRDVSSQTGTITLDNDPRTVVAEFANEVVSNGATTTITLDSTFVDPVVVASARYNRNTETQRTVRIFNKTTTSFDVFVSNYNRSLTTGTSALDYLVFEAGEWTIDDGASGVKFFASTTNTATSAGRALPDNPGGAVVTYPSSFSNPSVLASVVTVNDPAWTEVSVYDGTNVDFKPTATGFTTFLNDQWDANGHGAAEDIDFVVFETVSGTNNGIDFSFLTSGSANIPSTPTSVGLGRIYGAVPSVILTQALTQFGSDGGHALVDTGTPPTASQVTLATDEDGASADRGHAAEEVAIISMQSSGTFTTLVPNQRQFTELEYSVQATNDAVEGAAYCFRITNAGVPLRNYDHYPEATLSADVTVSSIGSQVATATAGAIDVLMGGAFVIQSPNSTDTITSLTIIETGSVDAEEFLSNVRLAVDFDTTAPYDCQSESYGGGEPILSGGSFDGPDGSVTFTGSGLISPTRTLCGYILLDVAATSTNGETIALQISAPNNDVVATGSVGPGTPVTLGGSTAVQAPVVTQTGYHWRNDDGTEAGATSASGGNENTPIGPIQQGSIQRLRVAVSNEGAQTATNQQFQIEYGTKVTTCDNVGSWQPVGSGPAFTMASTSQLIEGDDTTSGVSLASGGITDPNTTFVTPNAAQKESSNTAVALSLTTSEFVELEYALYLLETSAFDTTYCFRVTNAGAPLPTYDRYPELTTQQRQDFFVQRGTEVVSGTGTVLVAGVDYDAPASTSSAFVRITNTSMTGAGSDTLGATRNSDDLFAYLEVTDITSSVTIARPPTATDNTRVSWEIVEYVGVSGGDNEFVVRAVDTVTYGGGALFATGTPVTGVTNDADVVVFITGQLNPDTGNNNYNTALSLSNWSATSAAPVFERGDADGVAAGVSYAVVEFTGANWRTQRVEHTFIAAGVAETQSITAVNNLARTFLHVQKLSGDELFNLDESGHEVWLSSIGAVSFQLESGATNPNQQRSVAWVIENTQTDSGALQVYRFNGVIVATSTQPTAYRFDIGPTIDPSNASIFVNNRSSGPGSAHPRALLGASIISDTQFEFWKSDEGQNQAWRAEIVDWPVANTSLRQAQYRFYVDNDTLTPTDPWPVGVSDLGENTPMTDLDAPLGLGERVRLRVGLFVNNASLVIDSQDFSLEYGRRITSCSAISVWDTVGAPGSGSIWRGVNATPADGSTLPSTVLSASDVIGSYETANPSVFNPVAVEIGETVEFDWTVEPNGALDKSSYCFRMVKSDGAVFDGYDEYPVVRTSGYTPVVTNWRWYEDIDMLTPVIPAAGEEVAPIDAGVADTYTLRVALTEIEGAPGSGLKFNLQYSEYPDFRDGGTTLTASSSCSGGTLWCYVDGAGLDGDVLESTVLTGVDSCVAGVGDGCGTRNEAAGLSGTYNQSALTTAEHEFRLQHDGARVNTVYYFRLLDATNGVPVLASSSYPSIATEGAVLTFVVDGIAASTSVAAQVTAATTTATEVAFGVLPMEESVVVAQRLTVFTNGTDGYQVFLDIDGPPVDSYGNELAGVAGSNASPLPWATACAALSNSCFGYHSTDSTLLNGSTRFALNDSYAGVETGPVEVMASGVPVTFDVADIMYRLQVGYLQPGGNYETSLRYIIVPRF